MNIPYENPREARAFAHAANSAVNENPTEATLIRATEMQSLMAKGPAKSRELGSKVLTDALGDSVFHVDWHIDDEGNYGGFVVPAESSAAAREYVAGQRGARDDNETIGEHVDNEPNPFIKNLIAGEGTRWVSGKKSPKLRLLDAMTPREAMRVTVEVTNDLFDGNPCPVPVDKTIAAVATMVALERLKDARKSN